MKNFRWITVFVFFSITFIFAANLYAAGYTPSEIRSELTALAREHGMAPAKVSDLMVNVNSVLKSPQVQLAMLSQGVQALFLYSSVEGGFIVKFMKGQGLIRFHETGTRIPIELKTWSAGAVAGGSVSWGAGIVMGLNSPEAFGGNYTGSTVNATAADTTTTKPQILKPTGSDNPAKNHRIYLVLTGRGLSVDAGFSRMTITPLW